MPLKAHVRQQARDTALLLPSGASDHGTRAKDWRLLVNAEIEVEM